MSAPVLSPDDPRIYTTGLIKLWEADARRRISLADFVDEYRRHYPQNSHLVYARFPVMMHTRAGRGRPRMVVVDPNHRNFVSRFLWDVRNAMGDAWDGVRNRADVLINGIKADAGSLMHSLRLAPLYSVEVVQSELGHFEVPINDPIAEEQAAKQAAMQQRRANYQANAAPGASSPGDSAPVMRVRNAIGAKFAESMTALSRKANEARPGESSFAVVASPQATRVAAINAVRSADVYTPVGYRNADDFFRRHLKVTAPTDAINALSSEMVAQMRKIPGSVPRYDPEGLRKLYHASSISGPIMDQWRNTVNKVFTIPANRRPKTSSFRLANDYSLAVEGHPISAPMSAPIKWDQPRPKPVLPSQPVESPFDPFMFQNRTERTERHINRCLRDAALVRAALDPNDPDAAAAPKPRPMPIVRVPGESLLGSSMPAAEPISQNLSMPAAEPIAQNPAFESMPNVALATETLSVSSDPLAEEFTREVIAEEGKYAGVIVPDMMAMPSATRDLVVKSLRANPRRAEMISAYLLRRADTSLTLNALLSGKHEAESPVLAANGRVWRLQTTATGQVLMRAANGDLVPVRVMRLKERPEAVVIYTPLTCKEGQY